MTYLTRHLLRTTSVVLCLILATTAVAQATGGGGGPEGNDYFDPHDPGRYALVIGNADYAHLEAIGSAKIDAKTMAERLRQLRFDVTYMPALGSVTEIEDTLMKFRRKVTAGDVVVFYYSGHGFSYNGHSYLAPADLPQQVNENRVDRAAVAVESIESYLGATSPGVLVMLIDACRTMAGFVISDAENRNRVGKGTAPYFTHESINSLVGFAARPGMLAIGGEDTGKLSVFTSALAAHLDKKDLQFLDTYKYVRRDVINQTNGDQEPNIVDGSVAYVYLNPGKVVREYEEKAWRSYLATNDRARIREFSELYAVGQYAAAARRWLADHPDGTSQNPTSTLSPAAVERAWAPVRTNAVAVSASTPGFAFSRYINLSESATAELTNRSLGVSADVPGTVARPRSLEERKNALIAHGQVFTTDNFMAYESPSFTSGKATAVPANTSLRLVESAASGRWLEAFVAGAKAPLYIAMKSVDAGPRTELGNSLLEALANPIAVVAPALVNAADVEKALEDLRQAGRTIRWVSLATGATPDRREALARLGRIAHVEYLLKQKGIGARQITSVSSAPDVSGPGVRMRFFGY